MPAISGCTPPYLDLLTRLECGRAGFVGLMPSSPAALKENEDDEQQRYVVTARARGS